MSEMCGPPRLLTDVTAWLFKNDWHGFEPCRIFHFTSPLSTSLPVLEPRPRWNQKSSSRNWISGTFTSWKPKKGEKSQVDSSWCHTVETWQLCLWKEGSTHLTALCFLLMFIAIPHPTSRRWRGTRCTVVQLLSVYGQESLAHYWHCYTRGGWHHFV